MAWHASGGLTGLKMGPVARLNAQFGSQRGGLLAHREKESVSGVFMLREILRDLSLDECELANFCHQLPELKKIPPFQLLDKIINKL